MGVGHFFHSYTHHNYKATWKQLCVFLFFAYHFDTTLLILVLFSIVCIKQRFWTGIDGFTLHIIMQQLNS